MTCPKCGGKTKVLERRKITPSLFLRRRRCVRCDYRFNTYEAREKDEHIPLPVVVLDGKTGLNAGSAPVALSQWQAEAGRNTTDRLESVADTTANGTT